MFEPAVLFADSLARQAVLLRALEETTGEAEDMIVEYILVRWGFSCFRLCVVVVSVVLSSFWKTGDG